MKKAILFGAVLSGLSPANPSVAAEWNVATPESYIGFVATYDEIPFEARFRSFEAEIEFSTDDLESASFDVRIETNSLDSDSPDRDNGMKEQEWFASGKYPEARFQATRFERISGKQYQVVGELTVKDVSRTIEVPFTWERSGDEATLTAETRLKRGDFNIGTGEWAQDEIIGFDVVVKARFNLTRK